MSSDFKTITNEIENIGKEIKKNHSEFSVLKKQIDSMKLLMKNFKDDTEFIESLKKKMKTIRPRYIELKRIENSFISKRIKLKKSIKEICEEEGHHEWVDFYSSNPIFQELTEMPQPYSRCRHCDLISDVGFGADCYYYDFYTVYG